MTPPLPEPAQKALDLARIAYRQGDTRRARRWAEQAAAAAPDHEEPWLMLAAVANPQASFHYINRALAINPSSQRARQAMHWAVERLRSAPSQPQSSQPRPIVASSIPSNEFIRTRSSLLPLGLLALVIGLAVLVYFALPALSPALAGADPLPQAQFGLDKNTRTPTPTPTFTPTPTPTNTPTPTPTATFTPTPTATFTPTPTFTPIPTDTPVPTNTPVPVYSGVIRPDGVGGDEAWIDVDLSQQMAFAYRGDELVNSFVVSTGTWQHPTVTGAYRIYVKYRYADMYGPGYYLPDVPYVMYFYKGYGLHGTYWHNNFGVPMSHGCVNFTIDDAGWVFDFTSVGTVVNVHD